VLERAGALPAKLLAAIAACIAAIFIAAGFTPQWQSLELKGFDALTVATAPGQSSLPITIVGIDEASFQQIGKQWPWPREMHARLLDQLAKSGALVVAMDMVLADPTTPEQDGALADAIQRAGNVVVASDLVYQESAYARQWLRVDPIPALTKAGATDGFAAVKTDRDLAVREVPGGADVFWRAIVRRVNDRQPGMLKLEEPKPGAMIRYAGPDHTFPYVSYYQALDADKLLPPDVFRDQIVLVGKDLRANVNAEIAQSDLFPTPFTPHGGWLTPGVEIHANILETTLRGDALVPAPAPWRIALIVLSVLAAALAMREWRPVVSAIALLAIIVVVAAIDWALFMKVNTWLPAVAAILAATSVYFAFGAGAYLAERKRKGEFRRAFSLYVSPEVVDHVMAHPERLKLGGERREVTLLFTDLAGFTTFTEELGADKVTRILNVHFSRATAIVKRNNGTVNRFIGDAIMAMWGAPLEDPQQALHAVRAAVQMQEDMEALRADFRAEGLPEIRMRVGIHSCTAVIGNLGSSDRFDYTAVGDGVNLAARLEGVNKLYGTPILVSGETAAAIGGAMALRLVDRVIVKGKSEPVEIYTPGHDLEVNDLAARAIAAYRGRRWDESEALWRELTARVPADGIAAIYLARIAAFRAAPPDPEWDGAVELEKL
jgi:adenylate cyclase